MSGQRTCAPSEDGSDSGSTFQINATQGSNGRATFATGLHHDDSQEGDQNWYPRHSGLVSEGTSSMTLPDPGHDMLREPVYSVTPVHGTVAQDHHHESHQSRAMTSQIAFCSSMLYDRGGNMHSDIHSVASIEDSSCREGRKSNIWANQLPLCDDDLAWLAHSCVPDPDPHAGQFVRPVHCPCRQPAVSIASEHRARWRQLPQNFCPELLAFEGDHCVDM